MIALTIDQEFRSLISPLTDEERAQLAASLSEEGCRDPLVVWHGEPPANAAHRCPGPWVRQLPLGSMLTEVTWICPTCGEERQRPYVLLDGHHRYTICQRYEMPFAIVEGSAPDALLILDKQLIYRSFKRFRNISVTPPR
jgi:hypothetical protein